MRINFFWFLLNVILIFTLISCTSDNLTAPDNVNSSRNINSNYTYSNSEIEMMNLINTYRTSIGLKVLEQNNYISLKSEEHNNYMIVNNIASHDNFPTRSQNIIEVLGATKVAENIAYNLITPQSAFNSWMKSPLHKIHIEGNYTHFGISIRVDPDGKKYYTNIFIKR